MGGSWLKDVASQHKEWIKIVHEFGVYEDAEDIVQDAYLTLHKYSKPQHIIKNGKIVRGYMYMTLKSLVYRKHNINKRMLKVRLDNVDNLLQLPSKSDVEDHEAYHKICEMVDNVAGGWHWYDRMLWKIYSQSDLSMRKLAAETNISWVSIFNSLKKLKIELKDKLQEDYEDYKQQDWERINTEVKLKIKKDEDRQENQSLETIPKKPRSSF